MRIFCPEHKRGFFAPRQSPIRCENRGHILGELDFEGKAKPAIGLHWQYCCNCEHFCPIDFDHYGLERCPICSRRSSLLYLCDKCYTISFESDTRLLTKNFTLSSEGLPQPSCPGCLHADAVDLHEHACDQLGVSFVTPLNTCPICQERLDVGPSFPSFVAQYLKKTKNANKLNVTFDYESELFVPVADGEFVLINTGDAASQPIVIPRSPRLATRRDFYEYYQDYYHCAKPEAGQLYIIEPAFVLQQTEGWALTSTGLLEVVEDTPKKKAVVEMAQPQLANEVPDEPVQRAAETPKEQVIQCGKCGSLIETRYSFCWKCGNPLAAKSKAIVVPIGEPATALDADDDEQTVQHDGPRSTPFSWAESKPADRHQARSGSILKLLAVLVVVLGLASLGFFGLTRSSLAPASVTEAQAALPVVQNGLASVPEPKASPNVALLPAPQRTREDEELKKLREKRIGARPSDRSEIFQIFVKTEKKYPNDYRFPYERAKLAINGQEKTSRSDAFAALSTAAEKAIAAGKAREMLDSLAKDSGGDFQKLSHGHREWTQLQDALKTQDTKTLSSRNGL